MQPNSSHSHLFNFFLRKTLYFTLFFALPIFRLLGETKVYDLETVLREDLLINHVDQVYLRGSASLGTTTVQNYNVLKLSQRASAGESKIINNGEILFTENSSGGKALIRNDEDLQFTDSSSMGQADIINYDQLSLKDNADGGCAKIFNNNEFRIDGRATAAHAQITNHNIMYVSEEAALGHSEICNYGDCFLYGHTNAGDARIINDQQLQIFENATAGNATITNDYILFMKGNSSGGTAKIENRYAFYLFENATLNQATVVNHERGFIDISGMKGEGVSIGSLEGNGDIFLGSKNLTIGALGHDNTISGPIQDGVYTANYTLGFPKSNDQFEDNRGGSLTKIGRGIVTLTANNLYAGRTDVIQGKLRAASTYAFSPYSTYQVYRDAILDLGRHSQKIRNLTNDGCVDFGQNFKEGVTLTITEELNCAVGNFCMHVDLASSTCDHLVVEGNSFGSYDVQLENHSDLPKNLKASLELISTPDGNASFKLMNESIDVGAFAYTLERGTGKDSLPVTTNWYLVNTRLNYLTAAIVSAARSVPFAWFEEMSTLIDRMGELRLYSNCQSPQGGIWLRSYGQRANLNKHRRAPKFHCTQYGLQGGADKFWLIDPENSLYSGVFGGYSHLENTFHRNDCEAAIRSGFGGIYFTWINVPGWYVDAVVKTNYFKTDFKASHSQVSKSKGHSHNWGTGFSLEVGRRFCYETGCCLEPQLQFSYLFLPHSTFNAQYFAAKIQVSEIMQFRLGLLAAYQIESFECGVLELYGRISAIHQCSNDGRLIGGGLQYNPSLDGNSIEFSGGVSAQINDQIQFHLSYEAAVGERYTKPWGFNANVRYEF